MSASRAHVEHRELTEAISAAMVELYAIFYQHDRTTAITYNEKIVVCVLENILTEGEDTLIAQGARGEVIDGRVAFSDRQRGRVHRRDRASDPPKGGGLLERQPDHTRRGV